MKRKVTLHGPSTLTISLPSVWVNKYKIEKGDELDVLDKGRSLIVAANKGLVTPKVSINVGDLIRFGKRVITALYRDGVSEIELKYTNPGYTKVIEEVISKQIVGFEILKQDSSSCILKDLSGIDEEEFDVALRRSWLITLSMAQDCIEGITKLDKSTLESIVFRDRGVNKFTNYCARILVKKGHKDYRKIPLYYHLIRELERIADNYKDIAGYSRAGEIVLKGSILKNFEKANFYLHELYSIFYKFDKEKLENFLVETKKNHNELYKYLESNTGGNVVIAYFLLTIFNNMRGLASSIIQVYV
ncbi:phosphate uptake regulator PhoU [Candidatus Woesearchaeota archaeon]|nr:phosphate uptake regulator PhoU [Candidatus Woesearchaeota archaeon]